MQMDSRLPLMGEKADPIGNLSRGQSAAELFNKQRAAMAERKFLHERGQDLMAGDERAIHEYSSINLEKSMAIKAHFDAKKAAAARAAAAGAAKRKAAEIAQVQAKMDAVSVIRDEAMARPEAERETYFNEKTGAVLGAEFMGSAGLTLGNLDAKATLLAGQTEGLTWKPSAGIDPLDAAKIAKMEAETAEIEGKLADGDAKSTDLDAFTAQYKAAYGEDSVNSQNFRDAVADKFLKTSKGLPTSLQAQHHVAVSADMQVGSDEYNEFLTTDDAGRSALLRAKSAGLEYGSPEHSKFVDETRGSDENFKDESALRKEWQGLKSVKMYVDQADGMGRLLEAAGRDTAAGDLALIFGFMKLQDPTSVVRESEFATAEAASAWLQESEEAGITVPRPVAVGIRKMMHGDRLGTAQRADFVDTAANIYDAATKNYHSRRADYVKIAEGNGLNPEFAVPDFSVDYTQGEDKGITLEGMTLEDLQSKVINDPEFLSGLSDEQLKKVQKSMQEVGD